MVTFTVMASVGFVVWVAVGSVAAVVLFGKFVNIKNVFVVWVAVAVVVVVVTVRFMVAVTLWVAVAVVKNKKMGGILNEM